MSVMLESAQRFFFLGEVFSVFLMYLIRTRKEFGKNMKFFMTWTLVVQIF